MLVVMRGVLVQDRVQVPWPSGQHRVGDLRPGCAQPASGRGVRLGLRGGIFSASIFAAASTAPDAPVTCSARSPIRNRNRAGAFCQVHRQVPGLLHSPRPVRVSGDAQDMDMAGSRLDRQEHVQGGAG
jgi:hypothetical protein